MKNLVLLLSIYSYSFSLLAQNKVMIQGQALNGSADSTGVAGVELVLQKMAPGPAQAGEMTEIAKTVSSTGGQFQFMISPPDSGVNFFLSTDYKGARYFSELIRIQPHAIRVPAQIVVFDSTHDHQSVQTMMHHIFVQDAGASITVREMRVLNNPLNRTILNVFHDSHEPDATLLFQMPAGATHFSSLNSHFNTELSAHQQTVYFKDILEPGNRQVGYTYEIPWQDDQVNLTLTTSMLTHSMDFFLANADQVTWISGLTDNGPFTIREKTFQRYGAQDVKPGRQVQVRLQRRGGSTPANLPPVTTDTDEDAVMEHPYYAVGLTGALLLLALGAAMMKKPEKAKPMAAKDREQLQVQRKELLQIIARLDVQMETDHDVELQQQRWQLFQELVQVEARLQTFKVPKK